MFCHEPGALKVGYIITIYFIWLQFQIHGYMSLGKNIPHNFVLMHFSVLPYK